MVSNAPLWTSIQHFSPDDPSSDFQFSDRLARENGWSKAFALRAIAEYKKFVYLVAISTSDVTPSDVIDQAWHLHLTYTRSYWEELCGRILGKPLHHGPTKGGSQENQRYRDQYEATLVLYRAEFGDPPPAYWPPSDIRFAGAPHQQWIDRRTHLVIRKPHWRAWFAAGAASLAVVALAVERASASGATATNNDSAIGPVIAGLVVFGLIIAALAHRTQTRKKDDRSDGGSCGGSTGCGADGSGCGGGGGGCGGCGG